MSAERRHVGFFQRFTATDVAPLIAPRRSASYASAALADAADAIAVACRIFFMVSPAGYF
jgi:hypothetical protein